VEKQRRGRLWEDRFSRRVAIGNGTLTLDVASKSLTSRKPRTCIRTSFGRSTNNFGRREMAASTMGMPLASSIISESPSFVLAAATVVAVGVVALAVSVRMRRCAAPSSSSSPRRGWAAAATDRIAGGASRRPSSAFRREVVAAGLVDELVVGRRMFHFRVLEVSQGS
jgi:hypothetical protein